MQLMFTRMFAFITLISYLVLGTMAVRFLSPKHTEMSFSTVYLAAFVPTEISTEIPLTLKTPEISFTEIKIPVEKKIVAKIQTERIIKKIEIVKSENVLKDVIVAQNELPFQETVQLHAVVINNELETNLISYFKEVPLDSTKMMASVEDSVSTALAASDDVEPEFFDYAKPVVDKKEDSIVVNEGSAEVLPDNSNEEISVSDIATPVPASALNSVEKSYFASRM